MFKNIFFLFLLFILSGISFAQTVWGPTHVSYSRSISGTTSYTQSSLVDYYYYTLIGDELKDGIDTKYRGLWQWDISSIPDGSDILDIKLEIQYGPYANSFRAYFYQIGVNINNPSEDEKNSIWETISNTVPMATQFYDGSTLGNLVFQSNDKYAAFNQAIKNALSSDFFVLGIKKYHENLNILWGFENSTVKLTITWAPQATDVTIDQKLSNGTRVGLLQKYNGTVFTGNYEPPKTLSIPYPSNQAFQGDMRIFSNEKYNNWNTDADVTNFKTYSISDQPQVLTSNFRPIISGVTIKNNLMGTGSSAGSVQFKDPWLRDYADPLYGNTLRNRGKQSGGSSEQVELKIRQSPFYPNQNTSYSGDVYQGVFLNQSGSQLRWEAPYYTISTPDNQLSSYVSNTGKTHWFYFLNWSAEPSNSAEFSNSTMRETKVNFKTADAVLNANFKGTQLSTDANTFANNSQRKVISTTSDVLYQVYEENNNIWLEMSIDGGANWILYTPYSKPLNTHLAKSPSLDVIYSGGWEYLVITYYENHNVTLKVLCTSQFSLSTSGIVTSYEYLCDINEPVNPIIKSFENNKFIIMWRSLDFETLEN